MAQLTKYITAVSLHPLPRGDEIRNIVTDFLLRTRRPSEILRALADQMDAAESGGPMPGATVFPAINEADEYLPDYRDQVHRRTYRCTEEHALKLAAMSRATGLNQTSLIRLALAEATSREPKMF